MKSKAAGTQKARHIIEIGELSSTTQRSYPPARAINQSFPKYINEVELKHSVLTNGQPVLAAGEAEIAISGSKRVGITINRQTGHIQASEESLQIGVEEFKKHGIDFFDVVPNLFE
ncbi:MAG: hypothetical protein H7A01_01940 [Hahellaceae bacterium]|nr:hypothetical protein [Hahellaceae bacterium]MCP5212595.1 hypothetical protein [Hahellaceae bacterium]